MRLNISKTAASVNVLQDAAPFSFHLHSLVSELEGQGAGRPTAQ